MVVFKEFLRVAEHCRYNAGMPMPSPRSLSKRNSPPKPDSPPDDGLRDGRWCEDKNIEAYLFGKPQARPAKREKSPAKPEPPDPLIASLHAKNAAYDDRINRLEQELREERAARADWKRKYMELHPRYADLEAVHKGCNTDELMKQLKACQRDLNSCELQRSRLFTENGELRAQLEAHTLCEKEKSQLRMEKGKLKKALDTWEPIVEDHKACEAAKRKVRSELAEANMNLKEALRQLEAHKQCEGEKNDLRRQLNAGLTPF